MTELKEEFEDITELPATWNTAGQGGVTNEYVEWLEKELTEARTKLKNNGGLGDVSVSNYFDIHNCINDIEEVIKNKLSGWMFIKGTIRYEIKKAIDKMLYSR